MDKGSNVEQVHWDIERRVDAEEQADRATTDQWHDRMPEDLRNPIRNIIAATDQMLTALEDGRYRKDDAHIRAGLQYLRAEARRAHRTFAPNGGPQ